MLNRQLDAWRISLKRDSRAYLDSIKTSITVSDEFMEMLSVLEECERLVASENELRSRLNEVQGELSPVEGYYQSVEANLGQLQSIRADAETLLAKASPDDLRFQQTLRDFQSQILDYFSSFIAQADKVSELSSKRVQLMTTTMQLKSQLEKTRKDRVEWESIVNDFLHRNFGVTFETTEEQKQYLRSQVQTQATELSRIARLETLVADWSKRININDAVSLNCLLAAVPSGGCNLYWRRSQRGSQ